MKQNKIFQDVKELTASDKKTLLEVALKLSEEVGEVSEAVLSSGGAYGCEYKQLTEYDILEEAADVVITALSIMFKLADEAEIECVINKKTDRWRNR